MTAQRQQGRASSLKPLLRMLRMMGRYAPRQTALYLGFSVIRGVLPLVQLVLFKWIVDAIVVAVDAPDPTTELPNVMIYVIAAGFTYWLLISSTTADNWLRQHLIQHFTDHLFDRIHRKSITVGLAYYENSEFRDSLHLAQREALTRPARLIQETSSLFQNLISITGIAALLITVHWVLGPVLLLAALPDVLLRFYFSRQWYRWERSRTHDERRARYSSWVLTSTFYAKELLLYGLGDLFSTRFREQREQLRQEKLDIIERQSAFELIAKTVSALIIFGLYAFVAFQAAMGAITLGALVLVIQGLARGGSMIQRVLTGIAAMYQNNLFLTNLFEFLDRQPQLTAPPAPTKVPSELKQSLAVENLSFQYPNRQDWALRDVSFALQPNEVLAVIGTNGSGKTTLVKLLTRLYDPTEGRITLDGTDLRDFDPDQLRKMYSVIFQDFAKFHDSVRENIALGDPDTKVSEEAILAAARDAGVDEYIDRLPNGYDTLLGTWFADSVDLSEGQWQRLALARALVRPSRIVILDEPSSSLDVQSEHALVSRLKQVLNNRAAILISHRLSTIQTADRVLILEDGRVKGFGTPADLLAPDGEQLTFLDSNHNRV
ncbi:ABC transporter ATP-binding protein/permease [bacterium]|nr:ABC transporter ATP-binding protein/permease [bacterium]